MAAQKMITEQRRTLIANTPSAPLGSPRPGEGQSQLPREGPSRSRSPDAAGIPWTPDTSSGLHTYGDRLEKVL